MNNEELLKIRQQILDASLPLLLDSNAAPEDRFEILLRFIRLNSASKTSDLYKSAYDTALSFEDPSARLEALMNLLGEVDAQIDNSTPVEAVTEPVADMPAVETQEVINTPMPQSVEQQAPAPVAQPQEHVDN